MTRGLPEVISPSELAKQLGWSERRVRNKAKELGVHESTVRKAASGKYYSALRIRRLAAGTEKEGKE